MRAYSFSNDYVESIGGFKVIPDYNIQSIPEDYEALILIGSMSWK